MLSFAQRCAITDLSLVLRDLLSEAKFGQAGARPSDWVEAMKLQVSERSSKALQVADDGANVESMICDAVRIGTDFANLLGENPNLSNSEFRKAFNALSELEFYFRDMEDTETPVALRESWHFTLPDVESFSAVNSAEPFGLVPSPSEFQVLNEFAHGLTGEQQSTVFNLLLNRLTDAGGANGLPVRVSEIDMAVVVRESMPWKYNSLARWQGIQRDLNSKLATASINWRVSSRGGAHLKRHERRKPKRKTGSARQKKP